MPTDAREEPIVFEIGGERLALPSVPAMIVGRSTNAPGDPQPDVDLSAFGAHRAGVSRRHLKIMRRGELPFVTDLGSSNGTFLNGGRLIAYNEYALQSGDGLRLGQLRVVVRFPPYPPPSFTPPPSPQPPSPAPEPIFPPRPPKRLIAHAEHDDQE